MTVQKIKKTTYSDLDTANLYFAALAATNQLKLNAMELGLLSFIAIKGSISHGGNKQLFAKEFDCSVFSINNTVHQLKKKGLLEKVDGKINLPKVLSLDFSKPIILQITLDVTKRESN